MSHVVWWVVFTQTPVAEQTPRQGEDLKDSCLVWQAAGSGYLMDSPELKQVCSGRVLWTPTHDSCMQAGCACTRSEKYSIMENIQCVLVCVARGNGLGHTWVVLPLAQFSGPFYRLLSLYRRDITLHFSLRISGTPVLHLCNVALRHPFTTLHSYCVCS